MKLVVLVDALGDEEFPEKLDAVKYSSTLLVLFPHGLIRDLISLTTNPTNAALDSYWPSASHITLSSTSVLFSTLLILASR